MHLEWRSAPESRLRPIAQTYPDKPIKMIVPFPPGGPIDTMARLTGQTSTRLGQQVIVENRPGAGSTIGYKAAAAADPDGYTLLFGSSGSLGVAPALYPSHDIDPLKHFTPVATTSLLPHVMVVGPGVPPTPSPSSSPTPRPMPASSTTARASARRRICSRRCSRRRPGLDITYVPYKGSAPSVTDLLGGQTHFTIDGMLILIPQVKAGKFRALAVARPSAGRICRTCRPSSRAAFRIFIIDAWTGVVAPNGTPAPIVAKLNAAINEGLRTDEIKAALDRFSATAQGRHAAGLRRVPAEQLPKWAS